MNAPQPTYQLGQPVMMSTSGYPPSQGHVYSQATPGFEAKNFTQERQQLSRTPSPTPSEQKELDTGAIDWKTISRPKFWIRREWLWYYVLLFVILVVTALVTIYHTQIVHALQPVTKWLHGLKFGWLVPIGVLFVISFPPLFGHEIVAILCGLVWGLWIGFGIVAAGTFIGEVGNFYAFKYCCRSRGLKLERTKLTYACLARVVRDGGFKIALIARLSAIPGHFTTGIFSTCGMGIIVFSFAAILSLPKQFITVYLGVILDSDNQTSTKSKIISDSVLAITFIITFVAMWYIYREMNKAKPLVIYDRRKARQAKLMRGFTAHQAEGSASTVHLYGHNGSDTELPLTAHQQKPGHHKVMTDTYDSDPSVNQIYAPRPIIDNQVFLPLANPRELEERGVHSRNDSTYSVGWDPSPSGSQGQRSYSTSPNPYPQPQARAPYEPRSYHTDVEQTPTQAHFINSSSTDAHAYHPPSVDDDEAAYGGYTPVIPPAAGRGAHAHSDEDGRSSQNHGAPLPNPYATSPTSSASHGLPPSYTRSPVR